MLTEPSSRLFRWIGVDGIDGAGKTTCLELLRSDPDIRLRDTQFFDEFTTMPVGLTIRELVSERRFFSLSQPATSRFSDLLTILTDWTLKVEQAGNGTAGVFVSNRCHLSALAYQVIRLESQYGTECANRALAAGLATTRAMMGVFPGSTFQSILLKISEPELQSRVLSRGESPLSKDELAFLMGAQRRMEEIGADLTIDVSGAPLKDVFHQIKDYILHERR